MSDPRANGDDEREDLDEGERQYTSADLTAHDEETGQISEEGEQPAE
ncbi:hypothetical protein [Leifsonia sp. fls2-241-R2A-40a]|nr:hypothetical protein [Leifsonia sp. fls2-241-R2A-40a]